MSLVKSSIKQTIWYIWQVLLEMDISGVAFHAILTSKYIWNTAKIGIKHQSINLCDIANQWLCVCEAYKIIIFCLFLHKLHLLFHNRILRKNIPLKYHKNGCHSDILNFSELFFLPLSYSTSDIIFNLLKASVFGRCRSICITLNCALFQFKMWAQDPKPSSNYRV